MTKAHESGLNIEIRHEILPVGSFERARSKLTVLAGGSRVMAGAALRKITGREFQTVDTLYSSEDQLEGARAFTEKRDPVWKGK